MGNRFIIPRPQLFNDSGAVLAGGTVSFYTTGTSVLAAIYTTGALTVEQTNPLTLDSAGRIASDIFLDPSTTYKVSVKNSAGVELWSEDPVVDPAANVTAAIQVYGGNPNGSVAGSQGTQGGSSASMVYDITNQLLYVCTTTGTAATAVWTQVGAALSGVILETGTVTPTALAADTDNWDPLATAASKIRIDVTTDSIVKGMTGGVAGARKTIFNISSTGKKLTLGDDDYYTSSTAANRFDFGGRNIVVVPGGSVSLWYDTSSSRWRQEGSHPHLPFGVSGFRLTLTTAVPVLSSDVTAAATIYYTPYTSNVALLWNGSSFYAATFSEVSQTLADSTKSPLAAAVSSVYDMFLWNDAGTIRCTRGPAWTSATGRGTGAGTTELERVNGVMMNKVAITNGPAANRGIYVGTIATDASTQCAMNMNPAAAAGGTGNRLDVWNMYNRVRVSALCRDSGNSWNYTTATMRSANGSTSNRITIVRGLDEEPIAARYSALAGNASVATLMCGVGLDSTSVITGGLNGSFTTTGAAATDICQGIGQYVGLPGIGLHFLQALEHSQATGTSTWYGDNGAATITQSGLTVEAMM